MNDVDPVIQQRIDQHLDAIDRVLTADGMGRSERTSITDDVENQIHEMLRARAATDVRGVEAVLAELDPPEAYAQSQRSITPPILTQETQQTAGRFSRIAVMGAFWIALGFLALFAGYYSAHPVAVERGQEVSISVWQRLLLVGAVIGLAAPIGTTICGIVAISQIRRSRGVLYGLPLAVLDTLFFPLILLDAAVVGVCLLITGPISSDVSQRVILLPLFFCIVLDVLIARWVWRAAASSPDAPSTPQSTPSDKWTNDGTLSIALALIGLAGIATGAAMQWSGLMYGGLIVQCAALICGIIAWRMPRAKIGTCIAGASFLAALMMIT